MQHSVDLPESESEPRLVAQQAIQPGTTRQCRGPQQQWRHRHSDHPAVTTAVSIAAIRSMPFRAAEQPGLPCRAIGHANAYGGTAYGPRLGAVGPWAPQLAALCRELPGAVPRCVVLCCPVVSATSSPRQLGFDKLAAGSRGKRLAASGLMGHARGIMWLVCGATHRHSRPLPRQKTCTRSTVSRPMVVALSFGWRNFRKADCDAQPCQPRHLQER